MPGAICATRASRLQFPCQIVKMESRRPRRAGRRPEGKKATTCVWVGESLFKGQRNKIATTIMTKIRKIICHAIRDAG